MFHRESDLPGEDHLREVASDLSKLAREFEVNFFILGGIAVSVVGAPRYTKDVDAFLSSIKGEAPFIVRFTEMGYMAGQVEDGTSRLSKMSPVSAVSSLKSGETVRFCKYQDIRRCLDLTFSTLSLDESAQERASIHQMFGLDLPIVSTEDLLLYKIMASRDKDKADIRGILRRQTKIDWDYMLRMKRTLEEETETPFMVEKWMTFKRICAEERGSDCPR